MYAENKLLGFTIIDRARDLIDPDRPHLDNCMHVHLMESQENNKYKGIGTALHQIAVEASFREDCDGVYLSAQKGSHLFHYKCGFRAERDEINRLLEQLNITSQTNHDLPSTRDLGDVLMILTKEHAQQIWHQKITASPILSTNN